MFDLLADGMAECAAPASIDGFCRAVALKHHGPQFGIQSAMRPGAFVYRIAKYEPRNTLPPG
jgi:hypothetical protein